MVLPVGPDQDQELLVISKQSDGRTVTEKQASGPLRAADARAQGRLETRATGRSHPIAAARLGRALAAGRIRGFGVGFGRTLRLQFAREVSSITC